jgi:hypothetical protein
MHINSRNEDKKTLDEAASYISQALPSALTAPAPAPLAVATFPPLAYTTLLVSLGVRRSASWSAHSQGLTDVDRHVTQRILTPCLFKPTASYDVACNICKALILLATSPNAF